MGRTRGQKCPQSRQIGQCAFPQHAIAAEGWHWRLVRQWFLTTREDTGGPVWTSLDQSPVPLDRFSRPSHARFVGDVPLDGRMPKCDLCRCEIAHLRVLQVYVIETVLRKCTKLDKCRDERIQLCDILESDIDTNATAESVELCVGANDRRKPAPVGSSGTFQERLQVEF